eukprot:gnl/TRDRNA2_/TRDRNA2_191743_c0_seq1.p1 gnl/TRDRNA2_/TRDRNA2_191743_c0~~gnl/TRDRNA2_/TRDRNA2_191743_c0_seq1.p1  ORF type:complete len:358 (-),score=64.62 gnl/TRDRNA2_/TRDRNA2_191743_c0_seq1:142-1215(-)
MTNHDSASKLAELVTQAPEDEGEVSFPQSSSSSSAKQREAQDGYGGAKGKPSPRQQPPRQQEAPQGPCRCLFRRSQPGSGDRYGVSDEESGRSVERGRREEKDRELGRDVKNGSPARRQEAAAPAGSRRSRGDSPKTSSSRSKSPPRSMEDEQVMAPDSPIGGRDPDLPVQTGKYVGRKTLVVDLDETLVHSSFRCGTTHDILITVELEGEQHHVFVRKRPGVDDFLIRVAELYEVVVYTASMATYANPLLDKLDQNNVVAHRLFREACTRSTSGYVKDLSKLGRPLNHVIIIDNSPTCYSLQPYNAIPIKTWRDDPNDRELIDLIPILIALADVDDIPLVLKEVMWAAVDDDNVGK